MPPDSFSFQSDSRPLALVEVEQLAAGLRSTTLPGGRAILQGPSGADVAAAILGLEGYAAQVDLVPEGGEPTAEGPEAGAQPTRWVVYSSGSSGAPKPTLHTLRSLSHGVREDDRPRTWGLMYDPARLAGIAVVLQALRTGSALVEARSGSIGERVDAMRAAEVTALSATPTLWRQMLQSGRTTGWALDQVTLGGETSDQRILDSLAREFPQAHITHVFAATETGVAFSVGDGREGFPRRYLDSPPRGTALEVRTASSGCSTPDRPKPGWTASLRPATPSSSRRTECCSLGASREWPTSAAPKSSPSRSNGSSSDIQRSPMWSSPPAPNALSGQILVATVEARGGASARLPAELRKWSSERLPRAMVPAQFTIVEELPSSPTGKVVRS